VTQFPMEARAPVSIVDSVVAQVPVPGTHYMLCLGRLPEVEVAGR